MDNKIDVSVTFLCYNHGPYLRKCLDSVLMQEVNFKYEIIIGDDCSTDDSRDILREYEQKFPDIIRVLYNEKNLGASGNASNVRKHIRGKYVSGGESDDFWTDKYRLQKQYDFLEKHPEYAAVGSNFFNVDSDGNNPYIALLRWQVNKKYGMRDYLKYGFIVHGNTTMTRKEAFPKIDSKYIKLRSVAPTMGDVIGRIILYDYGPIYCLPDIMHAHRDGSKNTSSFMAQSKNNKAVHFTRMYFQIVDALEEYFEGKYNLNDLRINRIASMMFQKTFWNSKIDKNEYKIFISELPFGIKIKSYLRFLQKTFRSILHVCGRKLKLFYNIDD